MLSARNQFQGTVQSVKLGGIMAEVVVAVGELQFVSAITRTSAEHLNLQPGDTVTVIVKSTEVMVAKD
jgi:molybdopterin-binding protein